MAGALAATLGPEVTLKTVERSSLGPYCHGCADPQIRLSCLKHRYFDIYYLSQFGFPEGDPETRTWGKWLP